MAQKDIDFLHISRKLPSHLIDLCVDFLLVELKYEERSVQKI